MSTRPMKSPSAPKTTGRLATPDYERLAPVPRLSVCEGTRPRTAHVVDLDNIVGPPALHGVSEHRAIIGAAYPAASIDYQRRYVRGDDLVWVACDASSALAVAPCWRSGQLSWGRGRDGADRALLRHFDIAAAIRGCGRLVIASGDGVFTEVALAARAGGLEVVVVAWPGTLSRRLGFAASSVHYLGPHLEAA